MNAEVSCVCHGKKNKARKTETSCSLPQLMGSMPTQADALPMRSYGWTEPGQEVSEHSSSCHGLKRIGEIGNQVKSRCALPCNIKLPIPIDPELRYEVEEGSQPRA
mmetsp:Transcript_2528/g.16677  ORF Transcript_2528/g.16677 Transcript_2528/m.16677 type:complete len:106 (+) Transcript_2528:2-319(+)